MAKQMLIDATRGKKTEKAPWVPYAGVNCAYLINERADRYFKDPDILSRGLCMPPKPITRMVSPSCSISP